MIEIGRFYNIPLEERFCPLCKPEIGDFIEDEFHLLCICQSYCYERLELYNQVKQVFPLFSNQDDFDKFLFLNQNCQLYTAKFIAKAIQIRQNLIYTNHM